MIEIETNKTRDGKFIPIKNPDGSYQEFVFIKFKLFNIS
jgi:hypothetical protein